MKERFRESWPESLTVKGREYPESLQAHKVKLKLMHDQLLFISDHEIKVSSRNSASASSVNYSSFINVLFKTLNHVK